MGVFFRPKQTLQTHYRPKQTKADLAGTKLVGLCTR